MARLRSSWWFVLSLAVLAADCSTKAAIEAYTRENFHRVIVPGLITLVHSHNPGIAFGLLAGLESKWLTAVLAASSTAVILLLGWLLAAGRASSSLSQAGLALILGGAMGNLVDRLLHGSVTDFFEVRLGSFHWPAFNVADSAISIGAALLIVELLLGSRGRRRRTDEPPGKPAERPTEKKA